MGGLDSASVGGVGGAVGDVVLGVAAALGMALGARVSPGVEGDIVPNSRGRG